MKIFNDDIGLSVYCGPALSVIVENVVTVFSLQTNALTLRDVHVAWLAKGLMFTMTRGQVFSQMSLEAS